MPVQLANSSPSIVLTGEKLRDEVCAAQREAKTVGLVPTMGALHAGHLSLVEAAKAECDLVVTTIFVNPTQFGPGEDLARYPQPLEQDLELLQQHGCDLVFTPATEVMYPDGFETTVDVGSVAVPLEGELRPTHFQGVATVVLKLFQQAPANLAYFGQKDYQQTLVVKQMVRDLNVPIDIRVCPTVRERDGLAMSSRNTYLREFERVQASLVYQSLQLAKDLVASGEQQVEALITKMREVLAIGPDIEVQYISIVKKGTVVPISVINGPVVALVAVKLGETRLIDNIEIG